MALTIETLKNAAAAYVDATKQLQKTFVPTVDDFTKTVCKIGEMTTLYLPHVDKLPELSGDNLPFGETIEDSWSMISFLLISAIKTALLRKTRPAPLSQKPFTLTR